MLMDALLSSELSGVHFPDDSYVHFLHKSSVALLKLIADFSRIAKFLIQGGARDAETARRFTYIVSALAQRLENQVVFHLAKRELAALAHRLKCGVVAHLGRQVLDDHRRAGTHLGPPGAQVLELADVARPPVRPHQAFDLGRERERGTADQSAFPAQKESREQYHVVAALPQR